MKQKLPVQCPSCEHPLFVSQLSCGNCPTVVSGTFALPALLQMTREEQQFIHQFVLNSGSLKEMAAQMGVSYPTVRNKLDDLIGKMKQFQTPTE